MKLITVSIVLLMATCGGSESGGSESYNDLLPPAPMETIEADAFSAPVTRQSPPSEDNSQEIQKKVVKSGGLSYPVEEVKAEYVRLQKLLELHNAYIFRENESRSHNRINYNVAIKVPPQQFDALVAAIASQKQAQNKWIDTEDVTERYYDLQARISNKQKLEKRYQEILSEAKSVQDILEVERNLNEVRGEIETLQGQFKLLNHQISLSTLTISFYELVPYQINQESRPGFGARLLNAFSTGWQGFLTFFIYVLALWPFALLGGVVFVLIRKFRNRKKQKKDQ